MYQGKKTTLCPDNAVFVGLAAFGGKAHKPVVSRSRGVFVVPRHPSPPKKHVPKKHYGILLSYVKPPIVRLPPRPEIVLALSRYWLLRPRRRGLILRGLPTPFEARALDRYSGGPHIRFPFGHILSPGP